MALPEALRTPSPATCDGAAGLTAFPDYLRYGSRERDGEFRLLLLKELANEGPVLPGAFGLRQRHLVHCRPRPVTRRTPWSALEVVAHDPSIARRFPVARGTRRAPCA